MQQAKIMWITKHTDTPEIFQCSSSLSLQQYPLPTQFPSISTILKHNYWFYYIIDSYWFKPLNKQKKTCSTPHLLNGKITSHQLVSIDHVTVLVTRLQDPQPGFRNVSRRFWRLIRMKASRTSGQVSDAESQVKHGKKRWNMLSFAWENG